jgi:putative flippase GtrA
MNLSSIAGSGYVRFGAFGAVATLIHVVVFTVLVESFRFAAVMASIPAFLCAMMLSYMANSKWTFRASRGHGTHLPRYAMVSLFGLCLNIVITYVVVNVLGLWYGFALMVVITAVPLITYLLNRHWTYGSGSRR